MKIRNILLLLTLVICSNALNIKKHVEVDRNYENLTYENYLVYRENMRNLADRFWDRTFYDANDVPIETLIPLIKEYVNPDKKVFMNTRLRQDLLKLYDKDNNGKIDKEEFYDFYLAYSTMRFHVKLPRFF